MPAFYRPAFECQHDNHAGENKHRSHVGQLYGDDLRGDGGTYLRTHDDPGGLRELQKPRVDKAYHHDRRGRGALDERRRPQPHQNPLQAVIGKPAQHVAHPVARRALQPLAHNAHAVQEKAQPPA